MELVTIFPYAEKRLSANASMAVIWKEHFLIHWPLTEAAVKLNDQFRNLCQG